MRNDENERKTKILLNYVVARIQPSSPCREINPRVAGEQDLHGFTKEERGTCDFAFKSPSGEDRRTARPTMSPSGSAACQPDSPSS